MDKKFKKALFGYNPEQVMNEMYQMDREYQEKTAALLTEIEAATVELCKSEEKQAELEKRLNSYVEREHQIAEVMMTAQMNCQKIEEQAREKAHAMLEHAEEELKRKNQELEFLRLKVARFKEEFRETLDKYKFSLDSIVEPADEVSFEPTLIVSDKKPNKDGTRDVSS